MNIPRNSSWRLIRTCLGLAVAALCILARGDARAAEAPDPRELHQKQIADKSESERARLQRKFREFRELPADEQRRLRLLHDELKADDRIQGGLRSVMAQYHDWLATLTVGQREDLRKQTDPNVREKRVRELLKAQQEQAETTGATSGARTPRGLSSDDLAAVLGVVEQALVSRKLLTDEEQAQLHHKVDLARHMYVMELAYRRPGVPPMQQIGFAPKLVEAMTGKISNAKQQKFVQSKERPLERSWAMFNLLRVGLMNEYDKKTPDSNTLELFFVQLPSDKQDEIMRLPFDQQQQKLTHLYLEKKSEDDPDHYPRPPRSGFWTMRPPPGFRQPGRGAAEGNQSQNDKSRKKTGKNAPKATKAATGSEDASEAPEG